MASIFYEYCTKYTEHGLAVTPLNGKRPILPDWPNANYDEDAEYQDCNIGLICGERSKTVAVDVDINDHAAILAILPPTPCSKIGAKGITLFYKFSGEINEKIKRGAMPIIELLSTGNQTVLPPSIHPDTNRPYFWKSADLLSVDLTDLPSLDWPTVGPQLRAFATDGGKSSHDKSIPSDRCRHGSWEALKSYACALAGKGTNISIAIEKLIEADRSFNPLIMYFTDRTRGHKTREPHLNALKFYSDIMISIDRKREQRGEGPENAPTLPEEPEEKFKLSHFDESCVPSGLWKYCEQSAKVMETHPDYLCGSLLLTFTAVLGDVVKVYPSRSSNWFWRPKMSLCVVGSPSSRKSGAAALGPDILKVATARILKERQADIEQQRGKLLVTNIMIKKQQKIIEKAIENNEEYSVVELQNLQHKAKELRRAIVKPYIVNNATIQGLQAKMAECPGGYIQQFDELTGWLEFLESKGQAGARGEFLELMNQGVEQYHVTRKGEGLSLVIDHGHVSLIGTLQTDMFELFKAKRDGLIQRLNVINPSFRQPLRRENHSQDAWVKKTIVDFMTYCIEANPNEYSDEGALRYSPEAEKMICDVEEQIRNLAAQSDIELQSYLNKAMTMVYNLSTVYHAWENFCEHRKDKTISLQATILAANAVQVFISYAIPQYVKKEVDSEGIESIEDQLWGKILTKFSDKPFTAYDAWRLMRLMKVDQIERCLASKCSSGMLNAVGKNNRNRPIYSI